MAATTVSRPSLTDSTSSTTGDIVNAAFFGTNVYDKIDALFTASLTIERSSAGDIAFTVSNASNTAGSDATVQATVAGTSAGNPALILTVTSGSTWSVGVDNADSDFLKVTNSATTGANTFVFGTGGALFLGDNANGGMTVGITINQGVSDDQVLCFKSSDVAHGITTLVETDTFAAFSKATANDGGLQINAYTEATRSFYAFCIQTTENTTKSVLAEATYIFDTGTKSGTTFTTQGANANLFTIRNAGAAKFIFDADGDSHQDVGTAWTNFDDHEDVDLLHALSAGLSQRRDPVRQQFQSLLEQHRATLERARIVTFNKDGHHFINWSRFHMLITGAIRQQAMRALALDRRLARLEAAA